LGGSSPNTQVDRKRIINPVRYNVAAKVHRSVPTAVMLTNKAYGIKETAQTRVTVTNLYLPVSTDHERKDRKKLFCHYGVVLWSGPSQGHQAKRLRMFTDITSKFGLPSMALKQRRCQTGQTGTAIGVKGSSGIDESLPISCSRAVGELFLFKRLNVAEERENKKSCNNEQLNASGSELSNDHCQPAMPRDLK
ncbi:hypothetical protein M514_09520, partial [Trichuris suis]